MQEKVQATRRSMLLGLASTLPMGWIIQSASAQAADADEDFLWISKVITGSESISNDVAGRIEALLVDRVDGFASRLDDLIATMRGDGQGDRTAMLTSLTDEQVVFALDLAKPWYLGYVGSPSSFTLEDDAAFATFLEAQSWEKIVDAVPRITYPGRGPGWWDAAPPGVDAPSMPDGILNWTFRPEGPSGIQPPDPEWKTYATADHGSIDAARRAKPKGKGAAASE